MQEEEFVTQCKRIIVSSYNQMCENKGFNFEITENDIDVESYQDKDYWYGFLKPTLLIPVFYQKYNGIVYCDCVCFCIKFNKKTRAFLALPERERYGWVMLDDCSKEFQHAVKEKWRFRLKFRGDNMKWIKEHWFDIVMFCLFVALCVVMVILFCQSVREYGLKHTVLSIVFWDLLFFWIRQVIGGKGK